MTGNRDLIGKLALSSSVEAGSRQVADRIAARARQIDPSGEFEVVSEMVTIGTLRRRAWRVVNRSPDAAKSEFGPPGAGKTGTSGLRPLGRAARSI